MFCSPRSSSPVGSSVAEDKEASSAIEASRRDGENVGEVRDFWKSEGSLDSVVANCAVSV